MNQIQPIVLLFVVIVAWKKILCTQDAFRKKA